MIGSVRSPSRRPSIAVPEAPDSPPTPKTRAQSRSRLHQLMMPEHANMLGTVHGGEIMKLVDEVAAICAMRHAQRTCVTLSVDSMTLRSAVHVGQVIQLDACVHYVGTTSMEIGVDEDRAHFAAGAERQGARKRRNS